MQIPITDQIFLTDFRSTDRSDCVERINDQEIYKHTLRIPHPYTEAHFGEWLEIVTDATKRHGGPVYFAIREAGSLIGSLGFEGLIKGHRAEIGYWLAKAWWGRGIMTAAVGTAVEFAVAEWNLVRITAHVFASNGASARVLQKNGFECEGLLRKHYMKDGQFLDAQLYACVR